MDSIWTTASIKEIEFSCLTGNHQCKHIYCKCVCHNSERLK